MKFGNELAEKFKIEFVGRIIATAASTILTILLARLLGPDEYGLLFLTFSILGIGEIFSKLGVANSCARFISEYKEKEVNQIPHIIRISFVYNALLVTIVSAVVILFRREIAVLMDEPNISPLLLYGGLYVAFSSFVTFSRLVLQGYEHIKLASYLNILNKVCRLVCTLVFVGLGFGALGALIGYTFAFLITAVIGNLYIYSKFYNTLEAASSIEDGLSRRIGEYTVPLAVTSAAYSIDDRLDTVLIGYFLNPISVSYYVLAKQAIQVIEIPASALGFTVSPTFNTEKTRGDSREAAQVYENALISILLLYLPAASGLAIISESVISLIFGNEYLGSVPVLQIFSVLVVLQSMTKLTSNGLDFLGRARSRAIAKSITALLNICLNILLIPILGVVGAAFATIVTYSIYTVVTVFIMVNEIEVDLNNIYINLVKIILVTVIMSVVVLGIEAHIPGQYSVIASTCVGILVWYLSSKYLGLYPTQYGYIHN